jgi:molecular chaperone GrpE (heat shock protein)
VEEHEKTSTQTQEDFPEVESDPQPQHEASNDITPSIGTDEGALPSQGITLDDLRELIGEAVATAVMTHAPTSESIRDALTQALDAFMSTRETDAEKLAAAIQEISERLNLNAQWTVRQLKDFMGDPLEIVLFNRTRGFLNSLVQLYFIMSDFERKAEEVPSDQHRQNYTTLQSLLEMAFNTQNLIKISPKVGDAIDFTFHQPIEAIPCDDPDQHNTVARVVRDGFAFAEKSFIPALIAGYKYQKAEAESE